MLPPSLQAQQRTNADKKQPKAVKSLNFSREATANGPAKRKLNAKQAKDMETASKPVSARIGVWVCVEGGGGM